MKIYKRLFIIFCCTLILSSNLFMYYTMPVFAKPTLDDDGHLHVYNWDDIKDCAVDWVMYMASNIGAIFADHSFGEYVQNKESWVDYWKEDNVTISEDGKSVSFSSELMTYVKQCLDDYAKENEPYYMASTLALNDIKIPYNLQKNVYDSLVNLLNESPSGLIVFGVDSPDKFSFTDFGHWFSRLSPVKYSDNWVQFYRNDTWGDFTFQIHHVRLDVNDSPVKSWEEVVSKSYYHFQYHNLEHGACWIFRAPKVGIGYKDISLGSMVNASVMPIISKDGRRIRVFNTYGDFQNYTLGKRSVYYTSNYYDYVPEDLTTSIDDLQQTVDDLSGVIDQLLGQITKDTDESEIEDLLKQILDELKNNQGSGGGNGGGGDVNVDIDLSTTNTLLSKILAKVTQIFDKVSAGSAGTGGNVLKESLDAVLARLDNLNVLLKKYLSEITGDLDDIKGQLADMSEQEFSEKSDSFIGEVMDAFSEISEAVKTKFPFSIPNDLHIFLSKIAPAQPEAEAALYLDDESGISLYSGEHGGGGSSDGETGPPGGGGASRPVGSGFVSVDHGGGGGSREPAEMRDAPVFRLPIVIERYGIEEYIVIDMAPFDPLSRFSRSFFTMIFMVCLFNMTFKVIGMWGDLIG